MSRSNLIVLTMKKYGLFLSVLFLASFFIVSCSSSAIDADAKRLAEYLCQEIELMEEGSWDEYEALEEEIDAFLGELEEKYDFDDDAIDKKFEEAVNKALLNLDCGVDSDYL